MTKSAESDFVYAVCTEPACSWYIEGPIAPEDAVDAFFSYWTPGDRNPAGRSCPKCGELVLAGYSRDRSTFEKVYAEKAHRAS